MNSQTPCKPLTHSLLRSLKYGPFILAVSSIPDSNDLKELGFSALLTRYKLSCPLTQLQKLHILPAFIAIQNAVRIGEILDARCNQVSRFGQIACRGEKGSGARVVSLPITPRIMEEIKDLPPQAKLFPFSYAQVYQACRIGRIYEEIPGRQNHSVTHSGRYEAAATAVNSIGYKAAARILGHASPETLGNYCVANGDASAKAAEVLERRVGHYRGINRRKGNPFRI